MTAIVTTNDPKQNARIYWEVFGGLPLSSTGVWNGVVAWNMHLKVGGKHSQVYPYFQVSLYARRTLDGPNEFTLYRRNIAPGEGQLWKDVYIAGKFSDYDNSESYIGCLVLKVEAVVEDYLLPPSDSIGTKTFADQFGTADPPPWGVNLLSYSLYGSKDVLRNTRPDRILRDIVNGTPDSPLVALDSDMPNTDYKVSQLDFSSVPGTRLDALNTVNAMLGWDYSCYDGRHVKFSVPGTGTVRRLSADDPSTSWDYEEDANETFGRVIVGYTDANGKPDEEIVCFKGAYSLPATRWQGDGGVRTFDRADYIAAPASVSSVKEARALGNRYVRDHGSLQVQGSVTVRGDVGHDDAMLFRPGDMIQMRGPAQPIHGKQKVTHVTLHPLTWEADVQFGSNSKRLDQWLARLAAGARSIKRR